MIAAKRFVAGTALLNVLPAAVADDGWLGTKGIRLSARRDEVLFSEGDAGHFVYRVISGAVRLVKVMIDGRRYIIDFVLPGDFIGLESGATYGFTAEALADLEWVGYSRTWIDSQLDENPGVGRRLHELSLRRIAAAQNQMLLLGRMTARERLATFLLSLERRLCAHKARERVVPLAMTRMDIADHLGLTLETVSRSFNQLKRAGIIDLPHPQRVHLLDPDRLRELASGACHNEHAIPVDSTWHILAMLATLRTSEA